MIFSPVSSLTGKLKAVGAAGWFGYATLVVALILGLFGPWLAPYGHAELVSDQVWAPPSSEFWLGTDRLGRDMLSRTLVGAQTTILISVAATILAFSLGTSVGLYSAVRGGLTDIVTGRIVDLFMAIPPLIMALLVIAGLGSTTLILICTMGLIEATRVFRLARAIGMEVASMEYVDAAKVRGENDLWIILREILPNAMPPLAAEFGLRFTFAVLFLSALSFLGLGVQPPAADWGSLVKENLDGLRLGNLSAIYPAAAISLLTIGVNLLVDHSLERSSHGVSGELM